MLELSLSENIILAVLSFFTALMTSIAGAGGGTVLLAAMLQFMNPAEAIPVHGVIQFTSNITRTWLLRKFVNWNIIFKFSLLLPIGIFIGLKIFQNIENNSHMYFVHSYEFVPNDKKVISATTDYSSNIVCSVERENIFGTQFHPEKSDRIGLKIIDNFINL